MKCSNCGYENADDARYCSNCGQELGRQPDEEQLEGQRESGTTFAPPIPPPPQPEPVPPQPPLIQSYQQGDQQTYGAGDYPQRSFEPPPAPAGYYPQGGYNPPPPGRAPKNHLVLAIISTICCCWPIGIVAIVYAVQVDSKMRAGDYQGAQKASKRANMWSWIAIALGAVVITLWIIANIVAAISGHPDFRTF